MSEPLQENLAEAGGPRPETGPDVAYDFEAAVSRYQTPLLRYVGQIVGRETAEEAEDLVQETFLRLHRQVAQRGEASVRSLPTWLFRVAHNLALDAVRKRQRERRGRERAVQEGAKDAAEPEQAMDALGEMEHREACDKALAELHKLPDQQRHVLLLKIIQGMTLREIGEVTGLTAGNAAYRIDRGLRELSRRLKASGVI